MSSLAALRAKLQAQENKSQQNAAQSQGDNSIYPFWNLVDGQSSVIRYLPDKDRDNDYFWVERNMIRLPFPGVKGQNENREVIVQVPCMEMYGPDEKCPILAEVRTWYKDKSLEDMANKYWKKRTYVYQGFVRQNGLVDDKAPENPIRRFVLKPQIHKIIKSSLLDPDFDIMPVSYENGLDFKIVATQNGKWTDFVTSTWARRESALTEVELAAIENYGLFNLKDFLPKKPSDSELRIIKDMFEASVDGKLYDPDRWAAYFKPWGLQTDGAKKNDSDSSASATTSSTVVADDDPPFDPDDRVTSTSEVKVTNTPISGAKQDILQLIRSRQNKTT